MRQGISFVLIFLVKVGWWAKRSLMSTAANVSFPPYMNSPTPRSKRHSRSRVAAKVQSRPK